jgi:hypothetical protein
MKRRFVLTLGVLAGLATTATAQSSTQSSACPGGTPGSKAQVTQDACQKTVDIFQYMAPQLGGAITGGNATLGQGGTLGGLGRFTIGLRVNAIQGSVPKITEAAVIPVPTGARASNYNTSDIPLPMPVADAAVGVFAGVPLGLTNVLGVDLLASASYVPNAEENGVSVTPDNPIKLGYGVRVGLIQESIITPGVGFTFLKRDLPILALKGVTSVATFDVTDFDEETTAWRFVAAKSFVFFGLALGIGQDKYQTSGTATATATIATLSQTSDAIAVSQEMSRTNVFGDLSFNVPLFRFVLEAGEITSGAQPTTLNTFAGRNIVASRWYGSIGARFVW